MMAATWFIEQSLRLLLLAALTIGTMMPASAGETITFYHNDVAGSPMLATDVNAMITWRETYQPYGGRVIQSASGANNQLWFAGKPYDQSTGLTYMGARYYDQVLGRFVSVDPVQVDFGNLQSINRYAYANNNPIKFVDPDGREGKVAWSVSTVDGLGQGFLNAVPGAYYAGQSELAWGDGRYAYSMALYAAALGDAALGVVTLGESSAALAAMRASSFAARGTAAAADEAFHYTFSRAVASIEREGLRAGSYATPNGVLSPLQAHIDLALSPNRGLPDGLLRVDLAGLRRAGYQIPDVTQVGRSFGMPGGGFEMQFPYRVPSQYITVIRP